MDTTSLLVLVVAAFAAAGAGWWILRAYRKAPGEGAAKPLPAVVGVAAGAGLALALYLALGRPELPGQPYAQRLADIQSRDPSSLSAEEMMTLLAERARAAPDDPRPHYFTGQLLASMGRDQEAVRAFDAALRRDRTFLPAAMELGRAIVRLEGGTVGPDALVLFEAAAKLNPEDPLPWFYQALAASQAQRWTDAARLWPEVKARLPENDPRQTMASQMLAEARARGG